MEYDLEEWAALRNEVEHQGGALLPESCEGKLLKYKEPKGSTFSEIMTCTCGNDETMFLVNYDVAGTKKQKQRLKERGAGFARACGVCDGLGWWPRYEGALSNEEEEKA